MHSSSYPIRNNVLEFSPYSAGLSIEEIRKKYNLSNVIKLASNENPLGTSPVVQEKIRATASSSFRYAQPGNPRLLKAIANYLGVTPKCLVAGNGSDEIIDLLIRACPTPGVHSIVTSKPCFSLYTLQSKLCGVRLKQVPLLKNFSFDWKGLLSSVDDTTAMIFLTTPDNPTGYCPPKHEIIDFVSSLPKTCLCVVDEAYIDFCNEEAYGSLIEFFSSFSNLVILRTFSKAFGLAGIRLGYGIMPTFLAERLNAIKPPFSVNNLAEEAGIAALEDTIFYKKTLETVSEGKEYLTQKLPTLGCKVLPSKANFLLFFLPEKCKLTAKQVFELLLHKGIIIRPLVSYDMPEAFRVTVGTANENTFFIKSLEEILLND